MLAMTLTTLLIKFVPLPPIPAPQGESEEVKGHAVVEVLSDVGWIGPGQEFHIVVAITPDVGWHTYWENPGDSGAATEIEIKAPKGYTVGAPIFPRPEIFHAGEGTTFGYGSQVAIFIPVTAPTPTLDGHVEFRVTTSWFACRKKCVQGENETTLTLSVRTWEEGPLRRSASLARWQALLPKPLDELDASRARMTGNTLRITGKTAYRQISFLGIDRRGIRFMDANMPVFEGETFTISVPVRLEPTNMTDDVVQIEGLLTLGRNASDPSYVVRIIIDSGRSPYFTRGDQP